MTAAYHSIEGFWTDQRVQRLRALFDQGMSNNQIASELGIRSRNAVIGKLHRLGLRRETVRGTGITRTSSTHVAKRVKEIKSKPAPAQRPEPTAPQVSRAPAPTQAPLRSRVGLFDASPSQCRWPAADDGTAAMVCGAPKLNNQSYCAEHCRIAFLPPLQRRRVA